MAWAPRGGFGDSTGAGGGGFGGRSGAGDRAGGGGFDRGGGGGGFQSGFNRPQEDHVYGTTTVLPPPPEGWPRGVEWNLEAYRKMKEGKTSLTGVRTRSRKRDVKKKFEPEVFTEEVVRLIDEDLDDLDQAFANIQAGVNDSSSPIDFETYGETFWEIFVAGGIVAPGGEVSNEDGEYNEACVLAMPANRIPELNKLANGVLQRHRFMRPILEDVLCKVCMFVDKYDDECQLKLAQFMANFIIELSAEACMVTKLQQEKSLVDSGKALHFCTIFFREFLKKSTPEKLSRALKAGKADRVLTLMPSTKRTPINLFKHFEEAGLHNYAKYLTVQTLEHRGDIMVESLEEIFSEMSCMEEGAEMIQAKQQEQALANKDVITCILSKLHETLELTSKNRAKEYMKFLMSYAELLSFFTKGRQAETQLLKVMLEYIQDDPDLEKAFMPTCEGLYSCEWNTVGEDAIMEWYETTVKSGDEEYATYIEYMAPFVEWLKNTPEDA